MASRWSEPTPDYSGSTGPVSNRHGYSWELYAENLVLQSEGKLQSSKLFTHYKEWCRVMGYAAQDDKGFKSSLLQIDGVSHGRRRDGRYYEGLSYQHHRS